MNDTNNTNQTNINTGTVQASVPVQSAPPVQVAAQVQNVAPVQQAPVVQPPATSVDVQPQQSVSENSQSAQTVQQSDSNTLAEKSGDSDNGNVVLSKTEEEFKNAKLKFPVVFSILIFVFLIVFIVYYFVITNPSNSYSKILKKSVDRIVSLINFNDSTNQFSNSEISLSIDTKSVDFNNKDELAYIDGLKYTVNFNRDNENNNFEFMLKDNLDGLAGASQFTFSNPVKSNLYYMGANIYAKPSNDFIAVRSNLGNKEDDSIYSLVSEYLYEVIDNLNIDKVSRKFARKQVDGQTLLAIKYELDYNSSDIEKLSEKMNEIILDESKHKDFIKKLSNFTDMDETTIKNVVLSLGNLSKNTDTIKFNYYMNVSFTNLICMEMITDSGVFSLSYLNGYYFIDYKDSDNTVKFNLVVNFENFDIFGDIVVDTKDGYSHLVIDSNYELDDKLFKLSKNVITLKAYDKDSDKPYMSITADINHNYEEKIIKQDSIKSINRDSASAEDIQLLEYASSKVTYELSYLMVLFTKNKLGNVKDILNNMANNDNNVVEPDNSEDVPVVDGNVDNSLEMSTPSE